MKSFLLNKQRERSTLIMTNRVKEISLSRCDTIVITHPHTHAHPPSTPRVSSIPPVPLLTYGHRGHILAHAVSFYRSSSIEYFNRELCAMRCHQSMASVFVFIAHNQKLIPKVLFFRSSLFSSFFRFQYADYWLKVKVVYIYGS